MSKVIKVYGLVAKSLAILSAVVICFIMIVTVVDIIMRNFFEQALTGATEIVSMGMVAIVYFGVGYTTYKRGQITVDVLKVPFFVVFICNIVSFATGICFIMALLQQAGVAFARGGTSLRLHIPNWPFMYITAFGFFMMLLSLAVLMIWDIRNKRLGMDIGRMSETDLDSTENDEVAE